MAGRRARGRAVHGILLLDKPVGVRSNAALQRVKWLFKARKAGHTGSLDGPASGLLPICLGEATKLSRYLLDADKRYLADFHLGVCTDTGDAEGAVRASAPVPELSMGKLAQVLAGFLGPGEQIPPMYSAVKRDGQRLHALAYQGKEVDRKARAIVIHGLSLLAYQPPVVRVEVHCSKGTYIRALAEDVGKALGCGAHVSSLRRTAVGSFTCAAMLTLEAVEAASQEGLHAMDRLLLPMDLALEPLPRVELGPEGALHLRHGQVVSVPRAPERGLKQGPEEGLKQGLVRVYGAHGEFLGIGEVMDDQRIAPRRLLVPGD